MVRLRLLTAQAPFTRLNQGNPVGLWVVVEQPPTVTVTTDAAPMNIVYTPSIALSPVSGPVGGSVTVSGSGFVSSSSITVKYDGTTVANTMADSSGFIPSGVTFNVLASVAGTGHTVSATDASNNTASATFTVTSSITITSGSSGVVGSTITVSGSGFAANSALSATFGGSSVTLGGSTSTGSSGSFAGATFTVPASMAGSYTVVFSDSATPTHNSAQATFTVASSISLNPTTGTVGTTVTVSGSGFAANSALSATFGGSSVTLGGSTSTGSSGSFAGATFTVPASTAGSYTVVFSDSATPTHNSAQATFTVTLPFLSITFAAPSGMSGDATGTVLTIDGSAYAYSQLPHIFSWVQGSTHSVAASTPVSASAGKQYRWSTWTNGDGVSGASGTYTTPSSATTVTANYVIQWRVTFQQSGLSSDASGTVLTVGTSTYTNAQLPQTNMWVDSGTAYNFGAQVSTSDVHKSFERTSLTGPSSPITTSGTVIGIYGKLILRPESSGVSTGLTRNTGSANWDCVDESSSDGGTTYVYGTSSDNYQYDYYNIPSPGSVTGTITSVTVKTVAMATSQNSNNDVHARTRIYFSTQYGSGTDNTLTLGWTTYSDTFAKPGGGSWTFANIDSLQIGVGLRSHQSSSTWRYAEATQVWVEITFTPS